MIQMLTHRDGITAPDELKGAALIIGFGRFGQVASQGLLARGFEISIIENDVDMIRAAADFGFLVHYGDGTRLDILHAAGAGRVGAVLVCVDDKEAAGRIVELVQSEFPMVKLFVRAWDRGHAIDLIHKGVAFQIRDTVESALVFGEAALRGLGVDERQAADITAEIRRRDAERLDLQAAAGIYAGRHLMTGNTPRPGPLTRPRRDRCLPWALSPCSIPFALRGGFSIDATCAPARGPLQWPRPRKRGTGAIGLCWRRPPSR